MIDEHPNTTCPHVYFSVKPGGRLRGRYYRVFKFVLARIAKRLKFILGGVHVLNRVNFAHRVSAAKIEGSEIDALVGLVVLAMKGNPHKTALQHIFTANVKLNTSFGELGVR